MGHQKSFRVFKNVLVPTEKVLGGIKKVLWLIKEIVQANKKAPVVILKSVRIVNKVLVPMKLVLSVV